MKTKRQKEKGRLLTEKEREKSGQKNKKETDNPERDWETRGQEKESGRGKESAARREKGLFVFLFFLLIALFAHFVLFCRFHAAFVGAFLALCDCFVAAGSVLLALFANLMLLVRLDAAFVVAFLAFCLCLNATALACEDGAGANH